MKSGRDSKLFKKGCTLKRSSSDDKREPIEITSEKGPGNPLVKFSIGHDQLPKLKFKLDKPKKSGLSGLLERRRHSLASSDSPIDIFGLLPREPIGLSKEPKEICVSHQLLTPLVPNGNHGDSSKNGVASGSRNGGASGEASSKDNSPEAVILVNLELSNERFGKPKLDTSFKIMVGSFYDCIIPEDVEPLWGPIPLQKLPRGIDNKCRAVTHG